MRDDRVTNPASRASPALVRLPPRPTRLIGREREVAALHELLLRDDVRLVTVTGPPGVGKTRLAIEVADRLVRHFPDGVVFVDLSAIRHPTVVPSEIARVLGVQAEVHDEEGTGADLTRCVETFLEDKQMLLLLDNFEHVLDAASLIGDLLAKVASFKVLATSRAPLHLLWEQEIPLAPLSLPELGLQDKAAIADAPAVALFLSRARTAAPHLLLDSNAVDAVAEICRRLDGLPLAIELAAARSRMLPPALLLEQLARGIDRLPGVPQDLPERQRTLHRAVAWSYDQLDSRGQVLFRHLAVFAGGFTAEAAQAVSGGDDPVLPILAALADQHLIHAVPEGDRFRMLESLREFALARLEEAEETNQARRRHARYFMTLAEAAEAALRGPDQIVWLDRLDREYLNFMAAMQWCIETGDQETGLRIGSGLWQFWDLRFPAEGWGAVGKLLRLGAAAPARIRGKAGVLAASTPESSWWSGLAMSPEEAAQKLESFMEMLDPISDRHLVGLPTRVRALRRSAAGLDDPARAQQVIEEVLAQDRASGDHWAEARALFNLGLAVHRQGRQREALGYYSQYLALSRRHGDVIGAAQALQNVAWTSMVIGDFVQAVRFAQGALNLSKELRWQGGIRRSINTLGTVASRRGEHDRAEELFQERLRLEREAGDPFGVRGALNNLAFNAFRRGDYLRTRDLAEDCLQRSASLGDKALQASPLTILGFALLTLGDHAEAARHLRDALFIDVKRGIKDSIADVLEGVARLAAAQGDILSASRLLGTRDAFRAQESFGIPSELENAQFEANARQMLGTIDFDSAKAEGRTWSVERATKVALGILERAVAKHGIIEAPSHSHRFVLSRREQEVANLVAQGFSNREIAKRLFISERTADTHVQHILNKLGFNSRTQIAAWTVAQGLTTPTSNQ